MKKIGILTFHFADNYGALLQAFALQKAINSFEGCQSEIIDYIPSGFKYESRWGNDVEKVKFFQKRRCFEDFLKNNCQLSDRCNCITEGLYDIYCVGSDQVWNTTNADGNYFFQSLSDNTDKVSFATSISLKNNSVYLDKSIFSKYLNGFRKVSIRESENVELLNDLLELKCERQCDPTLLLDIKEYERIEEKGDLKGKYILFFWLMNDDNVYRGIEYVNRLSRELNLPVLHSLYGEYSKYINYSKGTMFYDSPGKFLYYIKNAEYVVTNSYHATLFSLRYKRKINIFIVESMKTRFETLFELYDIEKYVVRQATDIIKTDLIDYYCMDETFKREKERGYKYLSEVING